MAYGGTTDTDIDDMPHFEFVTNIYQAGGLTFVGAVTGAPLPIRFFPRHPNKSEDIETADGYENLAKLIERWNPPKLLLQDEAYYFWCDGVIGLHTEYIEDGERFGFETKPGLKQGEARSPDQVKCAKCGWTAPARHFVPPVPCPECGAMLTQDNIQPGETSAVPEEGEEQQIPQGRQIITAHGALELRRPQWAKEQAQFHYLIHDREVHYAVLRAAFPDKAEKIQPGSSSGTDDTFERNARLSVAEGTNLLTQTGGSLAVLCTHSKVWFRPTAFYALQKEKREDLVALFPHGCRVEFTGTTYLTSRAESMDDCWVVRHAMPGDGQHRPGVGSSLVSVQDQYNTETNIAAETYNYGVPVTYHDSNFIDRAAMQQQRAEPGANVFGVLRPGETIQGKIMQVRADSVSPDMFQHMQELRGPVSQLLTGEFPALLGNPETGTDTLGGIAIQRDQAMGRMGIPYSRIKQAHADIMSLACRDYHKHAEGEAVMAVVGPSGDFEAESIDLTALEGDATAYPEGDEQFPELWGQQRATFMTIMDSPQGQALMTEPANAELAVKLIGIPNLAIPGADARKKQLKEISEIVKGMPTDIDEMVDDHQAEAGTCKRYLIGEDGQRLKRENPEAYSAVRDHFGKHVKAAQDMAAQQAPPTKPLSESLTMAFKDMPPEAQAQILAKFGIELTPQDFMAKLALDKAAKAPGSPLAPGSQAAPAANAGVGG
jgi:ribosomal protein L37AE/L43A